MRFVHQKDGYSCSPIAYINALKWAGHKISWTKNKKELRQIMGTTREYGTLKSTLSAFLRLNRNYSPFATISRRYKNTSIKEIYKRLADGEAAIISYKYIQDEQGNFAINKKGAKRDLVGHTFFAYALPHEPREVYTVNLFDPDPGPIRATRFKKYLTYHGLTNRYPYHVWFIKKND